MDQGQSAHAKRHFQEELDQLKQRLLTMGGLAEERVRTAVRGLVDGEPKLMAEVIRGDTEVNRLHVEIDDRCFKLLALHQPMASDLRTIVAAVKINSDLERVGDLAVNIAEASQRYITHPPVKPLVDIPRMADLAQAMLHDALDAFVSGNVGQAQSVLDRDDLLDDLKNQVFRELLTYMIGEPRTVEPGLDLILVSRHLERVGDHATNIAEDVIFIVNALDVRHHSSD
jgi:phosphate transport system protein